jgi:hypothetical protein
MEINSTIKPRPQATSRNLKIEADGDAWKRQVKPKIRLVGRWLEQAGFRPGDRVQVVCLASGVIELRSTVAGTVSEIVSQS